MTEKVITGMHFIDDLNEFRFPCENELLYHIMFSMESDGCVLEGDAKRELEEHLRDALYLRRGCRIVDYLVMPDHLHLVMIIPPIHSVQEVVRDIQERAWSWSSFYCVSVLKGDEDIKLREWHDNSIKTDFAYRYLDYQRCCYEWLYRRGNKNYQDTKRGTKHERKH